MYYLMLFDWYVVAISVTIISILEAVSVYWIYGNFSMLQIVLTFP